MNVEFVKSKKFWPYLDNQEFFRAMKQEVMNMSEM
jgi:hypothetical protein